MNSRMISIASLALLIFIHRPTMAVDEAEEVSQDGNLVSISGSKLVMTLKGASDKKAHSHLVAPNVRVTLDGVVCKAEVLPMGTKIRVTVSMRESNIVTSIEAIDKENIFANTHDGKLLSVTSSELVMVNKDGVEHSHSLTARTRLSCDGKECKSIDLRRGMRIRVTTKRGDERAVVVIEAIDKNTEFL